MPQVTFKGTPADLRRLLADLPRALAGRGPDPLGLARAVQLRVGVALLSKVQQAFVVKARGGTGEDGIRWPPLKRETIAARRVSASDRKAAGVKGKTTRGLLTPAQDKRWRALYASRLARLRAAGVGGAEAQAAAFAWAVLKSEGAKTKLGAFGDRKVEMLRDTGELFRSLAPGANDKPSGAPGQVFQVLTGKVIIGTNKKPWHHTGIPGRLPARPLWPLNGKLPAAWQDAMKDAARRGVLAVMAQALAQGKTR